jgi:hypothetical protein
MADKPTEKKGPGIEGQMSGEGGLRIGDAAVSQDKEPYEAAGDGGLQNLRALDEETARALVSVARAMYPHDRIPDLHYERVVASLDEKAAGDEGMKTLLTAGVASLATLTGRYPNEFGALPEEAQVKALKRIERGAFFKAVASEVVVGLYSQPDIWPYFGYEGPSNDKGGYVDRGFDDIDWLDEAPDRRGNAIESTAVDPVEQVDTVQTVSKEG